MPVQSSDVALTFLDYAGVAPPDVEFESRSLRPFLDDARATPDPGRAVYCGTSYGMPMVRRGALKYMRHPSRGDEVLFDLDVDPGETENRIDRPEYQAARGELATLLREELARPLLELPITGVRASS